MRDNINKVSERGARLDTLQNKTDTLAESAQGFRRGANRVRKQMWWKDMKMRVCLIVGIIILLLIIIIPAGKQLEDSEKARHPFANKQQLLPPVKIVTSTNKRLSRSPPLRRGPNNQPVAVH